MRKERQVKSKKLIWIPVIILIVSMVSTTLMIVGCKDGSTPAGDDTVKEDNIEKDSDDAKTYEGTEIVFASQPTPSMDLLVEMIPEFEEATGIKVITDMMPYDSLVQKITIDTTTDTKQYSCFWMEPTWLGRFSEEFEPLEEYISDKILGKDFNLDDFSSNFIDEVVKYNGKILGVPFEGCLLVLAYREDIFEENNLLVPETFNDYLEVAKTINELPDLNGVTMMGKRGQPVFYEFIPYMWGFGAEFFDTEMNPTINSDEAIEALEYMIELSKFAPSGVTSYGWEESATAFLQGNVGSGFLFSDWIAALKDPESSKIVGKWNFAPVPGEVTTACPAGTINLGINADVDREKKEASFLFIKWATSPEMQSILAEIGASPTRLSVLNDSQFDTEDYRYFEGLKETYDITRTPMKIPEFFELNDALSIELSAAISGDKTAKEALDDAQEEWVKIMKEAGY